MIFEDFSEEYFIFLENKRDNILAKSNISRTQWLLDQKYHTDTDISFLIYINTLSLELKLEFYLISINNILGDS